MKMIAFLGVSRTDKILSFGAGFKYLLNRNLYLGGSYEFQQRNSTVAGSCLHAKHFDGATQHAVLNRQSAATPRDQCLSRQQAAWVEFDHFPHCSQSFTI